MSITLKYVVMGIAAILVLGFIWLRTRSRSDRNSSIRPAGRGLSDEMADAVDDVASEFLLSERARDHPLAGKDGHAKRLGKHQST